MVEHPALSRKNAYIRVKAISGEYIVSFNIHFILPELFGSSMATFSIPCIYNTLSLAVHMILPLSGLKLINLGLSGQKCNKAPLSIIAPCFEDGSCRELAMPTNVDVQVNTKMSSAHVCKADCSFFFP